MTTTRFSKKHTIFVGILLCMGLACLSYALISLERQRSIETVTQNIETEMAFRTAALSDYLNRLTRDVDYLSRMPPIQGIIRASRNNGTDPIEHSSLAVWQQRLATIFSAYLNSHPGTLQVRYIAAENKGQELVRVDADVNNSARTVSGPALQQKGHRDYVQETLQLPAGNIYVSDINLNREHNEIEVPYTPVLRVAVPVFEHPANRHSIPFGLVIINVDATRLFTTLRAKQTDTIEFFLTNASGDYLIHPDSDKTFGFDLGKRFRWQQDYQASATHEASASLVRHLGSGIDYLASSQKITLSTGRPNAHLYAHVLIPYDSVQQRFMMRALLEIGFVILASAMLCLLGYLLWLSGRQRIDLKAAQARASAIIDSSMDAVIGQNLEGVITDWNPSAEAMFGYPRHDALGKPLNELLVPRSLQTFELNQFEKVCEGLQIPHYSSRYKTLTDQDLDVSVSMSAIKDSEGTLLGIARSIRDVSEQVAIEKEVLKLNTSLERQVEARTQELRQYHAFQEAILNHAGHAIIATDTNGLITLFNPAAEQLLGYRASEIIGKQTPALFHVTEEVVSRANALTTELGQLVEPGFDVFVIRSRLGLPNTAEWTYVHKQGQRLPVQLTVTAMRDNADTISGYLGIAIDISEQVANRRALLSARDHLLKAAETGSLGIWTWDITSDQLTWNQQMFDIYQLPMDIQQRGVVYDDWHHCVHPDDVEATVAKLQGAVAGTDVYDPVFRIIRPDGNIRFVQAAAAVERDETGNPTLVLGINRDITEQREYEQGLTAAKEAADRANRAKSEFLANMSHEIRTPMNGVLGVTELLQRTQLDTRQREYLGLITNSAYALLNILNDILDLSKIEAGKIELEQVPFSLEARIGSVMKSFAPTAHEKGLELNYYIAPNVPHCVTGDPLRLSQIVFNLVGNAVKFTAQGEVNVLIDVADSFHGSPDKLQAGDALPLQIQISDTGIGIAEDKLASIFDAFSQGDNSTTRKFGGTGLGLNIVTQLVQLMGGIISVTSTPNRGSRFIVELTLQVAAETAVAEQHDMPWLNANASIRDIRCLAVDDNATNRRWLKDMLTSWGCIVDVAASVDEALQLMLRIQAANEQIDVLLLDKNMPEKDGFSLVEALQEHKLNRPNVILMLSSSDGDEDLSKCRDLGIEQYLVKPVQQSEIYNTLLSALGLTTLHAAESQDALPPRTQSPLNLLIAEDNPVNQRLVNDILAERGHIITLVDNGQKALELATSRPFDAVLMDVQMPVMDGLEATRHIRAMETDTHIRIIGLTAHALKGDKEMCLQAGMDEYLTKPIDPNKLIMTLEQSQIALPDTQTSATPLAAPNTSVIDLERGMRMTRGNRSLLIKMANLTITLLQETLPVIEAHCRAGDWQAAGAAIHKLKGAAGNMASAEFIDALHDLEALGADNNGERFCEDWPAVKAYLHQLLTELETVAQTGA